MRNEFEFVNPDELSRYSAKCRAGRARRVVQWHSVRSMPLPGFAARVQMYAMLIGYVACFKVPRFAINTLIPFVVRVRAPQSSLQWRAEVHLCATSTP